MWGLLSPTAKRFSPTSSVNAWETYAYLRFMLLGLRHAETDDAVRALLPTVPPPEAEIMTPISQ